jgi:phosphatidylglycerophosphate synthase
MNESAKAIDRRPIATRNRKWAQSATAWLAARNVSPNAISIAGMCACIAAGLALALTSVEYNRVFWLVAAIGAQLRLIANMLDGMVALASRRDSKVGELYNEVPDRVSDAAVFIGAGYAWGGNVALGYIATILAIFTAYVPLREKSLAPLTTSADQWPNNIGCWSLRLPACAPWLSRHHGRFSIWMISTLAS